MINRNDKKANPISNCDAQQELNVRHETRAYPSHRCLQLANEMNADRTYLSCTSPAGGNGESNVGYEDSCDSTQREISIP